MKNLPALIVEHCFNKGIQDEDANRVYNLNDCIFTIWVC